MAGQDGIAGLVSHEAPGNGVLGAEHLAEPNGGLRIQLPIAREILLAHGGDIRLAGSSDRGTEFLLKLPIESERLR